MGRLIEQLKKYKRIGLDTNTFIYLMEKHTEYYPICSEIFKQIEKGQFFGITSVLLITEVLTKPIKDKNMGLVHAYRAAINTFPNLAIKQIDNDICLFAAELRAKYGLKTPDAIFLATAIEEGAEVFITNDIRLRKIEEIDFIILDEYMKEI